ncbi:MAG: ABC transporter permease [Candidatus Hydrogenedentota bacterium]
MIRGLWSLTWVEFKVFMREPMGSISALMFPVLLFLGLGLIPTSPDTDASSSFGRIQVPIPVLAIVFIGLSNVTSLIGIISIYREGGILKRLRATPLRPYTILTAHVLVKLVITALSLTLLMLAGKTFGSINAQVNLLNFSVAIIFSFTSLMSIGFVIASIVPTARFAQPLASFILFPMLAFSPVFIPMEKLDPSAFTFVINLSPMTHVVNLLEGIWTGGGWGDHFIAILALVITFAACIAISTKVFRWE